MVEEVLREVDWRLEEKLLAVVGLGFLVGRPIAVWAMRRARNTLLFHKDSDFALVAEADLVVTGVGKSGVVRPEMLREGAGVIDFGYDQGRGDLAPECLSTNIAFYTPTPGGTGPILVAKLIENFVLLNAPAPRPAAQTRER
ncbi:hypothetical protein D6779_07305 [Candidatus Parcubacteria bacterium]|nr:MAG: hypothetical protein D6779_07305 [Candidatus Parcubacteria bacterium]